MANKKTRKEKRMVSTIFVTMTAMNANRDVVDSSGPLHVESRYN